MKKSNIKKSIRDTLKSPVMIVIGIILIFYVVFFAYILLWGFSTSVKAHLGRFNLFRGNEVGLPEGAPWKWQWSNYSTVLDYIYVKIYQNINGNVTETSVGVTGMLLNTMLYTFGGAAIQTLVPCFVAYATAKTNFKFSKIYDAVILAVMVIPIVGAQPSMLQVLNSLGLYDTWVGYYVQHAHTISAYYLIFQALFRSVPNTYSEAAYLDGAGEYTIMFKVVMPLAKTIMITVFLIHFITIWNDYNTPLIYMPTHPSLAYGIYFLVFENSENKINHIVFKMAGSYMLFTPILTLFICFRKTIMQNVSMGGLKE